MTDTQIIHTFQFLLFLTSAYPYPAYSSYVPVFDRCAFSGSPENFYLRKYDKVSSHVITTPEVTYINPNLNMQNCIKVRFKKSEARLFFWKAAFPQSGPAVSEKAWVSPAVPKAGRTGRLGTLVSGVLAKC